jgi:hypothetical protein
MAMSFPQRRRGERRLARGLASPDPPANVGTAYVSQFRGFISFWDGHGLTYNSS